jgi:hypothetical protein
MLAPRDEPQNQMVEGPPLEPKLDIKATPNVKQLSESANLRKKDEARKVRFGGMSSGKTTVLTPPKATPPQRPATPKD